MDATHIHISAHRFGNLVKIDKKDEYTHKQIIKLGSVLLFTYEWYDMHDRNRKYFRVWQTVLNVLKKYNLKIGDVQNIVRESEQQLILKRPDGKSVAVVLLIFAKYMKARDLALFIKEIIKQPIPVQRTIGNIVFMLLKSWGYFKNTKSIRNNKDKEFVERCFYFSRKMSDVKYWERLNRLYAKIRSFYD